MQRPDPLRFTDPRASAQSTPTAERVDSGNEQGGRTDSDSGSKSEQLAPLSPLELEVMDLVWDLQECTSADVIAAYGKVRQLADTTIRTVLTNIRKKGYLELVPSIDRGHRFRPTLPREQVARQTLRALVGRLFKGRARQAILLLLSEDLMTERDLEEIKRMVERRQNAVNRET